MSTKQVTLTPFGHFANGVASSLVMMGAVQPLDAVKNAVMRGQKVPFNQVYRGFAVSCMGIVPTQGVNFLTFGLFLRTFAKDPEHPTDQEKFSASVAAGSAAALVGTPVDRVKLVQQKNNVSLSESWKRVHHQDGYRGLYKGLAPMLCREVPFSVMVFFGFDLAEEKLRKLIRDDTARKVVAALATGAVVGFATTSPDLVKNRMQEDLKGSYSMTQTTKQVVANEGLKKLLLTGAGARAFFVSAAMGVLVLCKGNFPSFFPKGVRLVQE